MGKTDWPRFGRDVPGVAWRPDPEHAASTRLARFLRSTGERDLEALQGRAEADPAWFWGAAAEDLGLDVEIPWAIGLFAVVEMLLFMLTVFVAYAYVWRRGGLSCD